MKRGRTDVMSTGLQDLMEPILELRRRGGGGVVAVVVASHREEVRAGSRILIPEEGGPLGSLHPALDGLVASDARDALSAGRSLLRSYRLSRTRAEPADKQQGDVDVFLEVMARAPRLVVAGAGHIAVPLCRMATILGFEVIVLDDRPEYANRERFPDASDIRVGPYRETMASIRLTADTFIVLVTRGHVHDQACLEESLGSPAAYIGMIGSKRRVRTVMQHLAEQGAPPEALRRVHAPIGLDLGGETPQEIALEIMAEIVKVRRGGTGDSLALGERLRV